MAAAARALCARLQAAAVDHVVVTGDVTHGGRRDELAAFERAFAPLLDAGRVTLVPGNHDRVGDDLGARLMGSAARVAAASADGLHLVRVDSTGPHSARSIVHAHGDLDAGVLDAIDAALDAAPAGTLPIVLLHHHPLPLPEEGWLERLSATIGWPFARELARGRELLERLRGRCALLLHGHRHVPRALALWPEDARPLAVYNAGSSTELLRVRLFAHAGGALLGAPTWLAADAPDARPSALAPSLAAALEA